MGEKRQGRVATWAVVGISAVGMAFLAQWLLPPPFTHPELKTIADYEVSRVQLSDGRFVAYREEGVPKEKAKRTLLISHGWLNSRIPGLAGVKKELLEEFKVRLVAYDRPGSGLSSPKPDLTLQQSAYDMAELMTALGVDKFYILGVSGGGPHSWAAVKYIPARLEGVGLVAPVASPYAKDFTSDESRQFDKQRIDRRIAFAVARYLPIAHLLFLHYHILPNLPRLVDTLHERVCEKDAATLRNPAVMALFKRDVAESTRQKYAARTLNNEMTLYVNSWGFSLSELALPPASDSSSNSSHLFSGPIHIWHGDEDSDVPPVAATYAKRVVPQAQLHMLKGGGHFDFFCHCDSCHRWIFEALFGANKA